MDLELKDVVGSPLVRIHIVGKLFAAGARLLFHALGDRGRVGNNEARIAI